MHLAVGDQQGSRLRPKRAAIVALDTDPPPGATILCVDELGPVTPRNFPPAPGWSPNGQRSKIPLDDARGPEKTWVYGALCVRNGQALTQTAPSCNTAGYLELLKALDQNYPQGNLSLLADNLASHGSGPIQDWLAAHPRVQQAFIPVGAAWLNLAQPDQGLVADLPSPSLHGRLARRRRRHRLRHPPRYGPTQSSRAAVDLGPSRSATPHASS